MSKVKITKTLVILLLFFKFTRLLVFLCVPFFIKKSFVTVSDTLKNYFYLKRVWKNFIKKPNIVLNYLITICLVYMIFLTILERESLL